MSILMSSEMNSRLRQNIITILIIIAILALLAFIVVNLLPRGNLAGDTEPTTAPTLPADFPDDFPIFDDGKLEESKWTLNGFGQKLYLIQVEIQTPIASVADFYQTILPEKGWIVEGPHERQQGVKEYDLVRQAEQGTGDVGKSGLRLISSKDGSRTFLSAAVRTKE